jgi:hypothetical protein
MGLYQFKNLSFKAGEFVRAITSKKKTDASRAPLRLAHTEGSSKLAMPKVWPAHEACPLTVVVCAYVVRGW